MRKKMVPSGLPEGIFYFLSPQAALNTGPAFLIGFLWFHRKKNKKNAGNYQNSSRHPR
jgi:hypothetical protein